MATAVPSRLSVSSRDPRILVQAALVAGCLIGALAALLGDTAAGAPFTATILWLVVGTMLGVAWNAAGVAGTRALLVAAAGAAFLVAASELLDPPFASLDERPGGPLTSALTAVLALVAAASALTLRPSPTMTRAPNRSHVDRVILVGLLVIGIVATLGLVGPGGLEVHTLSGGVHTVTSIVHVDLVVAFAIGLVAWWWGTGWLLSLGGLAALADAVTLAVGGYDVDVLPWVLLGCASMLAGLRPPGRQPLGFQLHVQPRGSRRPTAAAVWAGIGAILVFPTLPLARFPPILVDCFARCPPPSPLAGPSGPVDLVLAVALPIAGAVLVFGRLGGDWTTRLGIVGVIAAGFVLLQVALGEIFDLLEFAWMTWAAPAALLLLVAFGAAAWRPADLVGTGRLVAATISVVMFLWIAGQQVAVFFDGWPSRLSGLVEAAIVGIVLALAFAQRAPTSTPAGSPEAEPSFSS